jgi:hypothetical protein
MYNMQSDERRAVISQRQIRKLERGLVGIAEDDEKRSQRKKINMRPSLIANVCKNKPPLRQIFVSRTTTHCVPLSLRLSNWRWMRMEAIPPGRAGDGDNLRENRCVQIQILTQHILKLTIGVEQLQSVLDAVVGFLTLNLLKTDK